MKLSPFFSASLAGIFYISNSLASPFAGTAETLEVQVARQNSDLGLPADGLKAKNGVPWGWLPDSGAGNNMAQINDKLGKSKASTYGWYAQITSSTFKGEQLLSQLDDVVASGAVFIPAVMPSIDLSKVDKKVAAQVADVLKKFTDKEVEVWLRFAHEINWYLTDGTYSGDAASYQTAWANIAAAVKSNDKIKMFWCPNQAGSIDDLKPFWPKDEGTVDIVGYDYYPKKKQTFEDVYGAFYDTYAKGKGKVFAIGETGNGVADDSLKEYWFKQIAEVDTGRFPDFVATCWFEYDKERDFRLVIGQSEKTVEMTRSELE
ncbi:glycoside hydrolase family 26 protein [Schizophyllum fasciatum]